MLSGHFMLLIQPLLLKGEAAFDSLFRADVQIENHIGLHSMAIEIVYPVTIQATGGIACKSGIDVAICQYDFAMLQSRLNDALRAIELIGSVEQAVGKWPEWWASARPCQYIRDER